MGRRNKGQISEVGGQAKGEERARAEAGAGANTNTAATKDERRSEESGARAAAEGKQPTQDIKPNLVTDQGKPNIIPIPTETNQKKPRRKKAEKVSVNENDIAVLISGCFSLVALKAGDIWNVTPDEAKAISKPLTNILDKYDLSEKVANMSDMAMLGLGTFSIMLPRIMQQAEVNKKKSTGKKGVIIANGQAGNITRIEGKKDQEIPKLHDGNIGRGDKTKPTDGQSIKAICNAIGQ